MSLRFLIVDDEPLIRMMLVEAFQDLGVEVVEADSGDTAWAVLESGQTFDLVFTDHVMPGSRTGTQLIADIENHFPSVRTALATGYMRGDRSANVSVFHKPYDVREVAQTLLKMVAASPFETRTEMIEPRP